jgi:ATP sulfurylase
MNSNNKPQEIEINADLAMDIELILNGGFSPLTTFLDK